MRTEKEGPGPAQTCEAPDFVCSQNDYADHNYRKHVVSLEAGWEW